MCTPQGKHLILIKSYDGSDHIIHDYVLLLILGGVLGIQEGGVRINAGIAPNAIQVCV